MNPKTLYKISYGVYIVSSKKDNKLNGQIANTVFQASAEPPTLVVSIFKGNFTHECILESNIFAISILSQKTPMKFIGDFGFKSGRDFEKLENVNYKLGQTTAPIVLDNTVGFIECKVANSFDVGTHTIFIGKVINAKIINEDKPMTYDYYHKTIKGKAPKSAPTYIKDEKQKIKQEEKIMKKYVCTVCGYIYDPNAGDPDSGIEPGTAFEDLPNDWVCPICTVGKDMFEVSEN